MLHQPRRYLLCFFSLELNCSRPIIHSILTCSPNCYPQVWRLLLEANPSEWSGLTDQQQFRYDYLFLRDTFILADWNLIQQDYLNLDTISSIDLFWSFHNDSQITITLRIRREQSNVAINIEFRHGSYGWFIASMPAGQENGPFGILEFNLSPTTRVGLFHFGPELAIRGPHMRQLYSILACQDTTWVFQEALKMASFSPLDLESWYKDLCDFIPE